MRQIFVNLPVRDLEKSNAFFASLGFSFEPKFTGANAACMIVEKDSIYAMLLKEPFFKTFIGFIYQHAFEDPDGHVWELLHMRGDPQ